jgi:hypothetical protein
MEGHVRQGSQCPQLDFAPTELVPFVASSAIKIWLLRSRFSTAVGSKVSAGLNTDSERVHKIMHGAIA